MAASTSNPSQELNTQLKAATDLHGHFGPFLALGVRMGLVGLRALGAKEGDTKLRVKVMLKYALPFSCVLDGIQTSTKCTVGNKRLVWKESKQLGAVFQLKNGNRRVEVDVNPAVFQELKRKLAEKPLDEEVRRLGFDMASRSEKELFLVRHT